MHKYFPPLCENLIEVPMGQKYVMIRSIWQGGLIYHVHVVCVVLLTGILLLLLLLFCFTVWVMVLELRLLNNFHVATWSQLY